MEGGGGEVRKVVREVSSIEIYCRRGPGGGERNIRGKGQGKRRGWGRGWIRKLLTKFMNVSPIPFTVRFRI